MANKETGAAQASGAAPQKPVVECVTAEFGALRAEILARTAAQDQLVNLAFVVSGSLVSLAVANPSTSVLLLFAPILVAALSVGWSRHDRAIKGIAGYIRYELEPQCPGLGWEAWLQWRRKAQGKYRRILRSVHIRFIFLILEVAPLLLGILLASLPLSNSLVGILGIAVAGVSWFLLRDREIWTPKQE